MSSNERQKRYNERQKERGLVRTSLWIPKAKISDIKNTVERITIEVEELELAERLSNSRDRLPCILCKKPTMNGTTCKSCDQYIEDQTNNTPMDF